MTSYLPRTAYSFFQAVIGDLIAENIFVKDIAGEQKKPAFKPDCLSFEKSSHLARPLNQDLVLVTGVSGGVDSMLLLAFLSYLQKAIPFRLVAAHLNHCLRPEAADQDQAVVANYCQQEEIEFFSRKTDIRNLAQKRGKGIEEAGRKARYDFFAELGAEIIAEGGQRDYLICLAHHKEDQAETILLNMGRGSGLDGLLGMEMLQGRVFRPFLRQSKNEITTAAKALQIPWQVDQSNLASDYRRNRLRNELLPLWGDILATDPAPLLARLAENLLADKKALQAMALKLYQEALLPRGELSTKILLKAPFSIAGRALNIAINCLLQAQSREGTAGSRFSLSERSQKAVLLFIKKDDTTLHSLELSEGIRADLFANTLKFSIARSKGFSQDENYS